MRTMGGRPGADAALPAGRERQVVLPEARARQRAGVAGDDHRADRQRHAVAGAGGRRRRARGVGGQPRVPRVPRLAVPRERPGARRRAAAGPGPAAGHRVQGGGRGRARAQGAARRARHRRATRRRPATAGCTCTSACEPRWDSYQVRSAAVAAARELERRRPDILTAAWWKEERGERIFVDYNQNAPHKTVFGAWSVRARKGGQVSTPLRWDELDDVDPERAHAGRPCPSGSRATATRGRTIDDGAAVAGAAARAARARPRERPAWTRRGRRSTRSSPTSRRASPPAAPARTDASPAGCRRYHSTKSGAVGRPRRSRARRGSSTRRPCPVAPSHPSR